MSVPSQFGTYKEPLKTTITLAVTTLSASIERWLGVNVLKKAEYFRDLITLYSSVYSNNMVKSSSCIELIIAC